MSQFSCQHGPFKMQIDWLLYWQSKSEWLSIPHTEKSRAQSLSRALQPHRSPSSPAQSQAHCSLVHNSPDTCLPCTLFLLKANDLIYDLPHEDLDEHSINILITIPPYTSSTPNPFSHHYFSSKILIIMWHTIFASMFNVCHSLIAGITFSCVVFSMY